MIAQELEVSLHMAFVEARQARHEFITVEHLLLALLDNPSAAEVLRACAVNIEDLRKTLSNFINDCFFPADGPDLASRWGNARPCPGSGGGEVCTTMRNMMVLVDVG